MDVFWKRIGYSLSLPCSRFSADFNDIAFEVADLEKFCASAVLYRAYRYT
jgi:hypothetical protein